MAGAILYVVHSPLAPLFVMLPFVGALTIAVATAKGMVNASRDIDSIQPPWWSLGMGFAILALPTLGTLALTWWWVHG